MGTNSCGKIKIIITMTTDYQHRSWLLVWRIHQRVGRGCSIVAVFTQETGRLNYKFKCYDFKMGRNIDEVLTFRLAR